MEFNYFYGSESEQFSFIKIPRIMLTSPTFSELSIQAKLLYGVLLDRMSVSMRNSWFDEKNRVYIIYQISEIQQDLGFTKKKAIDYLSELESFGLVEKKRRGHGLPSILYVKDFLLSRSIENDTSKDFRGSRIDTSRSSQTDTSRGSEIAPQEVPESAPLINYNKENYTNTNYNESNHIRKEPYVMGKDVMEDAHVYRSLIEENIDYEGLKTMTEQVNPDILDGIVNLMTEAVISRQPKILIASEEYPREMVRDRFLKLESKHILYVMDTFGKNTTKVKNIRKYLLAALFNSYNTLDSYYMAEVRHDMMNMANGKYDPTTNTMYY